MSFKKLDIFEKKISDFFGSPYAISIDSCSHAVELCLRYLKVKKIKIPKNTYLSIPMTATKLNLKWAWVKNKWVDYYYLENTNIIDAATYWKKNGYINHTFMCISFQYQKHINIGKGGMILTDNEDAHIKLKKMSHDGRDRHQKWRDQNIDTMGFHYNLTPENAKVGLKIFKKKSNLKPKKWSYKDYPDLSKMKVFK